MRNKKDDFSVFQRKIAIRFIGGMLVSIVLVIALYLFLWKRRVGDWIVSLIELLLKIKHEDAFMIYHLHFRQNREIFFAAATILLFSVLLLFLFRWLTRYFKEINRGIDHLLVEDQKAITLSPEMYPFENKLNTVKQTLQERKEATALAEQRKDDLVMYLAHDIRTPLTSVIGYLSLMSEEMEMTADDREKNVQIALKKACHLQEMINEFFEITRYNAQQIKLSKKPIDLYYMLVQLTDELYPVLSLHGNTIKLNVDEEMILYADPDKLARVFSNILKNAASYGYPQTDIVISARETETQQIISFKNQGDDIPADQLSSLFDKFYRLDEARNSDTGGTGLGLAIAKEIMALHGGSVYAESENSAITFTIMLPKCDS